MANKPRPLKLADIDDFLTWKFDQLRQDLLAFIEANEVTEATDEPIKFEPLTNTDSTSKE